MSLERLVQKKKKLRRMYKTTFVTGTLKRIKLSGRGGAVSLFFALLFTKKKPNERKSELFTVHIFTLRHFAGERGGWHGNPPRLHK